MCGKHLPARVVSFRNFVKVPDVNNLNFFPIALAYYLFSRQITQPSAVKRGSVINEANLHPFTMLEDLPQKEACIAPVFLLVYRNTGGIVLLSKTLGHVADEDELCLLRELPELVRGRLVIGGDCDDGIWVLYSNPIKLGDMQSRIKMRV